MFDLFKTVLLLSVMGAGATLILILLKPLAQKRFPAMWQRGLWIVVAAAMLIPFWRFIPRQGLERFTPAVTQVQDNAPQEETIQQTEPIIIEDTPMEYREIELTPQVSVRIYDLIAYIWFGGMCLFIALSLLSYVIFLFKKRKSSMDLAGRDSFDEVKRELKIKRKIRIRISSDASSPMLVGTIFPVIYIPSGGMDAETEKMVFRHELNHYKHGDLLLKWLTMLVNAVHWFNPFAYLLTANVNEACEVSCDMAVIKGLDEEEQRFYMETILKMLEKGKK